MAPQLTIGEVGGLEYSIEPVPDSIHVNGNELLRMLGSSFSPFQNLSRSEAPTADTILGTDGEPLIYVVNYGTDNGFALISALKTARPILACNATGHFDVDDLNPTVKYFFNNIKDNVEYSLSLPADSTRCNRAMWKMVEVWPESVSRYNDYEDDFDTWPEYYKELYESSYAYMSDFMKSFNGTARTLDGGLDYYSSNLEDYQIEEIYQFCEGFIYPPFTTRYKNLSFVGDKTIETNDEVHEPLLDTEWNQDGGYNMSYPTYDGFQKYFAGCGPVAAGQIMRFHRWPERFNWDDMPQDYATKTTSDFLYQIAVDANPVYNKQNGHVGVTIENIAQVFKNYGYDVSDVLQMGYYRSFNNSAEYSIFVGARSSDDEGHAFVICGYKNFHTQTGTYVYAINRPNHLENIATYNIEDFDITQVYINWGYGGKQNGFFDAYYMAYNDDGKEILYNRNVEYIIVKPVK